MSGETRLRSATERIKLRRAFGERLRELRLAEGFSPSQLDRECRLVPGTIADAEHGRGGEPGLLLILAVCHALDVGADALLGVLPAPREHH